MISVTGRFLLLAALLCLGAAISLSAFPRLRTERAIVHCGGCNRTCEDPIAACTEQCRPPQCECLQGFFRYSNGSCILLADCPEPTCGQNEFWAVCSGCDGSCRTPDVVCSTHCRPPRCECLPGFVRDDNLKCIPLSKCPTMK